VTVSRGFRRALVGAALTAAVVAALLPGAPIASAAASAATVAVPSSFSFSGAGWGHGVGMSQYGARGMALDGYTGEQIVQHYYTGTTVTPVPDTMDIRVNVLHRRASAVFRTESLGTGGGGIRVQLSGQAPVYGDAADTWTVKATSKAVTITRTRKGVTTTLGTAQFASVHWAGTRSTLGAGTGPTVLDLTTSVAGLASSGHRYRYGYVDFGTTAASPTTLEAVNSVRLHDEYLYGIGEVSSSWPRESLRAQVLASRSYALATIAAGQRSACRCHVDGGKGPYYDQTFLGYLKETSAGGGLWRAAVASTLSSATTGEAILYAGKAIKAFYFAASGGATRASSDVWGGALPYAVSVDDHWSLDPSDPWSAWTPRVRTQAQVAAAFGLPNVVRIDLSSRQDSGALRTAVAWSSSGASASISGSSFASRMSLPALWVWRTATTTLGGVVNAAARAAATSSSTSAVVAPAGSPSMIAVASTLAARKGWPLLLSSGDTLPAATVNDLKKRKAAHVLLVGTAAELSASVATAVSALGATPSRITGADDSEVSANAATWLGYARTALAMVASADDPVDAAIASAAAARSGRAFLLVPGGDTPAPAVAAYLASIASARTLVVGPASAVSDAVMATFPRGTRLAGADSGATSALVVASLGTRVPPSVVVASSATATAGLLASRGVPLVVLRSGLPASIAVYLQRGVSNVITPSGTPAALVWLARRA
jgi:stage II sporulation protein D